MKTPKKITVFSCLLALMLLLTACGGNQVKSSNNKALNVTLPDEPATVDPNKNYDTNSTSLILQSMEGLYKYDKNNNLVPGVAIKIVKPTNNGTTYTFKLRDNAKWSNGDPVTAEDFVTSFRRTVDPKTNAQFASLYEAFMNFNEVQKGTLTPDKLGVTALDKHTLKIQLSHAVPYFNDLAAKSFLPLNTAAVEKYGSKYGTSSKKAVYNGPYKVIGWSGSNSAWYYTKNHHYWNAKNVRINRINVKVTKSQNTAVYLFNGGKVQETTVTGQYIRTNKNDKKLQTHLIGRLQYLYFNNKKTSTNSENLRQALSYVINRKELTNNVLQDGSKPALSTIPIGDMKNPVSGKDMATEQGNMLPYDAVKAKQYWKKYLAETGKKQVTLNLLTDDSDDDKHVGQFIQSVAEKYFKGLNVTLTSIPHAQHVSRDFAGNFEINLTGWSTSWLDASDFLSLAAANNAVNFTHWQNEHFNQLLTTANKQVNPQARYANLKKANQYLMEVKGYVPLYQASKGTLVADDVGGLNYSLLNDAQYQYAYWK